MKSSDKRQIEGVVVKLLHDKRIDRGMTLAPYETRCVRLGEIHELVTTDERGKAFGDRIDRVGFIGFVEITRAGVVEVGDEVIHEGHALGHVLGFDECHFPNHYNILIASDGIVTADDIGLRVEERITFRTETEREEN
jgi:hypothetical protein